MQQWKRTSYDLRKTLVRTNEGGGRWRDERTPRINRTRYPNQIFSGTRLLLASRSFIRPDRALYTWRGRFIESLPDIREINNYDAAAYRHYALNIVEAASKT